MKQIIAIIVSVFLIAPWTAYAQGNPYNVPGKSEVNTETVNATTVNTDKVQARSSSGLSLFEDGGSGLFVKDGGNVGISTTGPNDKLEVNGNVRADSFNSQYNAGVWLSAENNVFIAMDSDNDDADTRYIDFLKNDNVGGTGSYSSIMRIQESGNVGIGTTSPGYELEVSGDIYASGDVSALTFTDRTPSYDGDALAAIKNIKGIDGHIDHDSLPVFAQSTLKRTIKNVTLGQRVPVAEKDAFEDIGEGKGKASKTLKAGVKKDDETGEYYTQTETVTETVEETPGRDLGAMISVLTKAVQQLTERIEALEK